MISPTERLVEDIATVYFSALGVMTKTGVDLDDAGEREGSATCLLNGRIIDVLHRLNPHSRTRYANKSFAPCHAHRTRH